jgi:hypothetical protein
MVDLDSQKKKKIGIRRGRFEFPEEEKSLGGDALAQAEDGEVAPAPIASFVHNYTLRRRALYTT